MHKWRIEPMNVGEMDYGQTKLLAVELLPSRYVFLPNDSARIIGWQIIMADDSTRDVLFSEISGNDLSQIGSEIFFNGRSAPIGGFRNLSVDHMQLQHSGGSGNWLTFAPKSDAQSTENYLPTVSYRLSELYFRVEISLKNNDSMPIYWRPAIHFYVNLPWLCDVPMEKYIVKCLAKKRLRLSDTLGLISSSKSSEKFSLELLNDGAIGLAQLQDSRVWIGTSNEEEGISFIFGHKSAKSAMLLRKTATISKVEIAFLSCLPVEGEMATNQDLQTYAIIAPGATDSFAAEISAY